MPKGYVIVTEAIHDAEGMKAYGAAAFPSMIEFGAKVLSFGAPTEVVEGSWHGDRTVMLEFESVEKAHEWYDSSTYQAALPLRLAAAESNAVVLTGMAVKGE